MTIEGLRGRHPLQRAFVEHGGAQCGICTPGMIMAAVSLGRNPSLEQMKTGLAGNLCRCTGYSAIYRSIAATTRGKNRRAREERRGLVGLGHERKNRGDREARKSSVDLNTKRKHLGGRRERGDRKR
jgi:hypothetical protein